MTIKKDKQDYSASDQAFWRNRMKTLTFGQTVRAYRLAEGWSQVDAAKKIGMSKQQLSDYESGRKLPSIGQAFKMANALGMMPESAVLQVINEQLRQSEIPIQVELTG